MSLPIKADTSRRILAVAVPVPLRQTFDFIAPVDAPDLVARTRVKVSFGKRNLIGVIITLLFSTHW